MKNICDISFFKLLFWCVVALSASMAIWQFVGDLDRVKTEIKMESRVE